ncbi:transporter substrate-binding domain-containing protein [Pseudomonas sp. LY10J]|uniref:Transporter substrate-binding domain-containing protein n=1 Tax=Pseudomonas quercus TaxID=2722792 RepID=A0ABX0YJK2_9PSED|nr:transporter substrate-binding domain-containing protein [Pseudomonas sp. LY10J]NJP02123.1 transporter substrate-binding domain-containing protein [Pseudomonas quercus]
MFTKPWRAALVCVTLLGAVCAPLLAQARETVRVAATHFPPYAVHPETGGDTGLLPELLAKLNKVQDRFTFVMVPTALPRRFQDFRQGRVDITIFENPQWGWQAIPHTAVDMGLEDAEVFVARNIEGRDEEYFTNLSGKRLALYSGYHYAFAGFEASPEFLMSHYRASLTYSHDSNLLMVARDRADIALVTRSYLVDFYSHYPQLRSALLVSQRTDQRYHHYALVRPQAPITGPELAGYFEQLHANGEMLRLFSPYHIDAVTPTEGKAVIDNTAR